MLLHPTARGRALLHQLLRAKARVGQAARWRPSPDGMKQVFQGLAACGAIVISIAAADKLGGMIGT